MPSVGKLSRSASATSGMEGDLPPGPDMPAWQLAKLWIEQPVELWESCAADYGETFTLQLGSLGTVVLFSHPEAVRQIFQLPPAAFECQKFNEVYKYTMGARSLLVSDGADHARKQRLVTPALHGRVPERYGESIRLSARRAIDAWPTGRPFSPRLALHMVALELILRISLGSDDEGLGREIREIFAREIYRDLTSWGPWTRFVEIQPRLREMIAGEIRRRRATAEPGGPALLDAMVRMRDSSGALLEDEEIQDHVFTMVMAGIDTTALAICWAIYWIHQEPGVLDRLRRDLTALGPAPEARAVVELPYLGAVCQESLRMYPVVMTPTGRKLLEPAVIHGRRYAPGVSLVPCTYLVQHREDLYPDPARFRPERFLERAYAPHEYFPFGGGVRTCTGASLAPQEMKLVLAEVVTRCTLTPAHTGPVRPVRHGALLAPSNAMQFILTGRRDHGNGEGWSV